MTVRGTTKLTPKVLNRKRTAYKQIDLGGKEEAFSYLLVCLPLSAQPKQGLRLSLESMSVLALSKIMEKEYVRTSILMGEEVKTDGSNEKKVISPKSEKHRF